ncbi:hypothetical protein CHL76_09070 [Marinococcus halophilus]|uniref:Uncharacterized protein n=1 Tax=Marinococcus halophilus TaxID=1371 RepID=A0A510Y4Q7_MARHA|nr:hypothetical protein CHL76_09070 [Marinococcus halophilus]GEK58304.1 hypothetical protein MHA01_12090 [Marinococcus halophilus]
MPAGPSVDSYWQIPCPAPDKYIAIIITFTYRLPGLYIKILENRQRSWQMGEMKAGIRRKNTSMGAGQAQEPWRH